MVNKLTERGLFLLAKLVKNEMEKKGIVFSPVNYSDFVSPIKFSLYDIQKLASKICLHFNLLGYTPVVTYDKLNNAAGNINLNMDLHIFINLDSTHYYTNGQIVSILAHEIAHKFLYVNFIRYEGLKNEFITDATAIYAGFGNIMANNCVNEIKIGNTITKTSIGYLIEWQIRYLINCFNGKFKEEPVINSFQQSSNSNENYSDFKKVRPYYHYSTYFDDSHSSISEMWYCVKCIARWLINNPIYSCFILLGITCISLYFTFGIDRYDPNKELEKARIKAERDSIESERNNRYIYADDSTRILVNDKETEYHNNKLENGSKPYQYYFGNSITGSNYLGFLTKGERDCIVIVKNMDGKYYNHVYICGDNSARVYLPNGMYNVYFYFGIGWNPDKKKGELTGGFEEKESQQRNDSVLLQNQNYVYELYPVTYGNLSLDNATTIDMFK